MVVSGQGVHDNKDLPEDADRMFGGFVRELEEAGHHVGAASFQVEGGEPRSAFRDPPNVGDKVIFLDTEGAAHPAEVTYVWSHNCVNLRVPKDGYGEYTSVPRHTKGVVRYCFMENPKEV